MVCSHPDHSTSLLRVLHFLLQHRRKGPQFIDAKTRDDRHQLSTCPVAHSVRLRFGFNYSHLTQQIKMALHGLLLTCFAFFPRASGPHFQMSCLGELEKGRAHVSPQAAVCLSSNCRTSQVQLPALFKCRCLPGTLNKTLQGMTNILSSLNNLFPENINPTWQPLSRRAVIG